jgi:hypothetical protein
VALGDPPNERRWPDHRPEAEQDSLARLVTALRGMRFGLMRYSTGDLSATVDAEERWSMLLERYDATLVRIVRMLDVPLPSQPPLTSGERKRLTDEGRADLEGVLRGAGIDV